MFILGLDPSLAAFGWALHDTEAEGSDRCLARGRFETSARMLFVDRLTFLRDSVGELLVEFADRNVKVGMEQNIYDSYRSVDMGQVFAYTCEALFNAKVDMFRVLPKQLKVNSRFLIKWPKELEMDKPQMVSAAKADTGGGKRWNHDEADAYLAGRLGGRFWKFHAGLLTKDELSPEELYLFLRTHTFSRGKKKGKTERKGSIYRENDRFFLWSSLGDLDGGEKKEKGRPRGKKRRSL